MNAKSMVWMASGLILGPALAQAQVPVHGQPGVAYPQPGAVHQPGQNYPQSGQVLSRPGQFHQQPEQVYPQPGQYYPQPGQYHPQPGQVYPQQTPQYTYQFSGRRHLDRLAAELERQANDVCWEMHRYYQANNGWKETYREAYQVLQDSKHVLQLVRDRYRASQEQDHVAADLHNVDKLFHHVQGDVAQWRPTAVIAGGGIAGPHDPYVGQVQYGGDLTRKMQIFEQTLHNLMTDYGVRSQLGAPAPAGGAIVPGTGAAPPPQP